MCQYRPPMIRPMPLSMPVSVLGREVFTPGRIVIRNEVPIFVQKHLGTVSGLPWEDTVRHMGRRVGRLREAGPMTTLDLS